jgi:hypothetical protein
MPQRRFETWDSLDLGMENLDRAFDRMDFAAESLTRSNGRLNLGMETIKLQLTKLAEINKNRYPPTINTENRIPSTSWGYWLLQFAFSTYVLYRYYWFMVYLVHP